MRFWMIFIHYFTQLSHPLYYFKKKNAWYDWARKCQGDFEKAKVTVIQGKQIFTLILVVFGFRNHRKVKRL